MEEQEKNQTIKTFAIASFLNDMGSDIIYPIWPIFVTQILGANMAILGLLDGLGEALVSISQAVSGYLSDRLKKRKIFIWIGYFMGGLSRLGYGLSTTYLHLIPFRILDRAGKIRSAPRDALVADYSNRENRGRNFGLLRTADNLGAVVGILICLLLFNIIGIRNLFLLAAIPSLIGAVLIIYKIKEPRSLETKIYKGVKLSDFNQNFRLFLLLSAFFALGSFSYSFLLIYAKEVGFKVAFVPVLYLIFTVFASLFSLPFGKLADKIGRKKVLFLSYILWGLVCLNFIYLIFGYPQILAKFIIKTFNLGGIHLYNNIIEVILTFTGIITAFILYGLHKAALEPVQKTLVAELAPAEFRASALGGFQMVIGLCALPSSLIAGVLWDKIGRKKVLFLSYILWGLVCLNFIYLIFGYPQILAKFIIKTFNLGGIHLYSNIIEVILTFTGIITAFILYGLHKAALEPVQKTLVAELAPAEFRASALGGFQMVIGLCALPSSLIAGVLWDKTGLQSPLLFSIALTVIALTLLTFVREK